MKKCRKHPKYKAIRRPKKCEECFIYYCEKNKICDPRHL